MSGGKKVATTSGELEQTRQAKERHADYEQRFVPLEETYFGKVQNIRNEGGKVRGVAAADSAAAFNPYRQALLRRGFSNGGKAGDGQFLATLEDMGEGQASAASSSIVSADQGVEDRYTAGVDQLISLGRGQSKTADIGARTLADIESQRNRDRAAYKSSQNAATAQVVGMAGGAATRAYMPSLQNIGTSAAKLPGKAYLSLAYPDNYWASAPGNRRL